MQHALPPFALVLTLMAGSVASATGSADQQNNAASTSSSNAAAIYGRRCASCHGKDGTAKTFKGKLRSARNLTDPQWQADVSDERIFNSIMNGRGKMPSYGKKLSEAEINSLVAYVRGLKK
jgi:mono/diheme cytochrome c family protein